MTEQNDMSMAAYNTAAFGDRIRGIRDLLDLIRDLDLTQLTGLVDAIRELIAADTLKDRVLIGVRVLELAAQMTANDVDDKLAAMIASIATPEMIDAITRIVEAFITPRPASEEDTTAVMSARSTLEAKGIPWGFIMQVVSQLMELFRQYLPEEG